MQDDIVRQPPANSQPPTQPADTTAAEPAPAAQPPTQQEPVKQAPEQVVEPPQEAVKVAPKKGPSSPVGVIIFAIIVFLCLAGAAAYLGMTQSK